MRYAISVLIAACILSLSVISIRAQENENLLAAVPKGYKVSNERKSGAMTMREMVPSGETSANWTEMVSVTIFPGMGDVSPTQYRSRMQLLWEQYCPGSDYAKIKEGIEHGYATLTWHSKCPRASQTGKPELSWTKVIQGRDNLYAVQRAYRFEPLAAKHAELSSYLDSVRVCDARLPDRPCR